MCSCCHFWGGSTWSADIESADGPFRVGRGDARPLLFVPPEALFLRLLWGLWLSESFWHNCNILTTTAFAAHIVGDEAIAVPEAAPGWVGFVVRAVFTIPVLGAVVGVGA